VDDGDLPGFGHAPCRLSSAERPGSGGGNGTAGARQPLIRRGSAANLAAA
jgi:hypothetical protein